MKKLLFFLVMMVSMIAVSTQSNAQRATLLPIAAGDTVSTSSSLDTVSKVITVTAGYSALGIQVVATKVGGTITAKAYLYGSIDGTNYTLTDSATAFANSAGAQSAFFTKTGGLPYVNYKVMVRNVGATTSTETLAVKVYYVARRYN